MVTSDFEKLCGSYPLPTTGRDAPRELHSLVSAEIMGSLNREARW